MKTIKSIRLGAIIVLGVAAPMASADTLVDPTRPYDRAAATNYNPTPSGPVLQSTIVSKGARSAVISGKRVRVGDTYNGAVITDIAPYEVRMTKGGRETSLRLLPKLAKEKGAIQ